MTARTARNRRARPRLAALTLALLLAPASGFAQGTVVIGGSGGTSPDVQVDMGALGGGYAAPGAAGGRLLAPVYGLDNSGLRIPGERRGTASAPIQLRPPGGVAPALAARAPDVTPPAARPALTPPPAPPLVQPAPPQESRRPAPPAVNLPATTPAPASPTPPPVPSASMPAPPPAATAPTPPATPPQVATTPSAPTPTTPPAAAAVPTQVAPPPPPAPPPAQADSTPAPTTPARMAMAAPPMGFGDSLALAFVPGSASLTREAEAQLDKLAALLRETEDRLQLKAFASADADNTSRARRTSLSRALAVRSYLIEAGIRSTRIDVRALGVARDGGAEDRVDVILLNQ